MIDIRSRSRLSRPRSRHRRGVEFIEFAILIPFFLFFITFAIDLGRLTMLQAGLQDATQQVARGGSQLGGWGNLCNPTCATNSPPYSAFTSSVNQIPGHTGVQVQSLTVFTAPFGSNARASGLCSAANPYITAKSTASTKTLFLTPGLYQVIGVLNGQSNWTLTSTAVARCEVAKQ